MSHTLYAHLLNFSKNKSILFNRTYRIICYTVNVEIFAGLNFHGFCGSEEYYESFLWIFCYRITNIYNIYTIPWTIMGFIYIDHENNGGFLLWCTWYPAVLKTAHILESYKIHGPQPPFPPLYTYNVGWYYQFSGVL